MSKAVQQKSQEFKRITIEKRGKDYEVRVPSFPKELAGESLKRAIGKMAYESCNDNRDKAVALVANWLLADHQLLTRIYNVHLTSRECVDDFLMGTRPAIKAAATHPGPSRMDGIRRAANRNLMEYPLRRGKHIGDATRPLLLEETKDHRAKGTNMLQHAVWCELMAKELPDDKTQVRAVLKEVDLERFLKQAQKLVA